MTSTSASTSTGAATRAYTIDPAHSSAHFSVRHLMISKVRGTFDRLSGSLVLPADSPIPISISAQIDAASINTRDAQRDGHLKSADFFEVEKFPKLVFTSTRIEPIDGTRFKAIGDLEIHGVKRQVTIDAEVSGQGKDPWGNDRVAYEATTRVSRKDFGLVWNQALEAGGVAVGDEIDITIDVESIPTPA
jgi:polyisoprenoid-binding protein YceI